MLRGSAAPRWWETKYPNVLEPFQTNKQEININNKKGRERESEREREVQEKIRKENLEVKRVNERLVKRTPSNACSCSSKCSPGCSLEGEH
jgi:hypothetical protein